MRGDDERTLGGGLGAAIFLMPLIFGWLVFRKGYHVGIRIAVGIYMLLSVVPLYYLVSLLWNSGDEVQRLARDYDKNRAVAERYADKATSYIEQYEDGELKRDGESGSSKNAKAPMRIDARSLALQIEKDNAFLNQIAGRPLEITGSTIGAPAGNRVFLAGGESYPAVMLEYEVGTAAEGTVRATCAGIRLETVGPILEKCR